MVQTNVKINQNVITAEKMQKVQQLNNNVQENFGHFVDHIEKLQYDEKPDYNRLRALMNTNVAIIQEIQFIVNPQMIKDSKQNEFIEQKMNKINVDASMSENMENFNTSVNLPRAQAIP